MNDDATEPMGQLSAHLDRGWDLVSRGDYAGARVSAEKSLELDETSPEAHNLLGFIYQAEGRAEDALRSFEAALDMDETFVEAMLNAAEVLVHSLDRSDEALAMLSEALDVLEEDEIELRTDALLLELQIHLDRGDRAAAEKTVKALPDGPFENPLMTLAVGRARLETGDTEGAEPLIRAGLDAAPNADAFLAMGQLLEVKGDRRGAITMFLRARDMDLAAPPPPWSLEADAFERRVQSALAGLPPRFSAPLEGALVVVLDLPGAEVVADGVDPRTMVLLDALPPESETTAPPSVGRLFVYKRNVERMATDLFAVEREVTLALEDELVAVFPALDEAPDTPPS